MKKTKFQVFVSSTYEDLKEEREAAVSAILNAGHIPAGMEAFQGGKSTIGTIKKWIDDSDVFVLILGGKYGTYSEDIKMSFTQMEYEYAISQKKEVFAIVLSDKMLHKKAITMGDDKIYERKRKKDYLYFKNTVLKNVVHFVDSLDQVPSKILSQLNYLYKETDLTQVGWVKASSLSYNYNLLSEERIKHELFNCISELLSRNYGTLDLLSFSKVLAEEIPQTIHAHGIYNSVRRDIQFEQVDDKMVKVTFANTYKYLFLQNNHQSFGFSFHATQQQASSFRVERLIINKEDFTDSINVRVDQEPNRGQLCYKVSSTNSIPLPSTPCEVIYQNSYICPALDFFFSHCLPFPCKRLTVNVTMKGNLGNKYSVLASTFSPFSSYKSDSYLASEIQNYLFYTIEFDNWSVPGTGFVLTLKEKTKDNH